MSDLIPPMLVEIQLETAKIKEGLASVNSSLDNFGKTVARQESSMAKFKTMALGVFGGNLITQGVQALTGVIRASMKDVEDYQAGIAKAGSVIASTGNVAGVSVGHFKEMAKSLEDLGVADQNVILQSENVMATFTQVRNVMGKNNDIYDQSVKAALDLSTVMKGDLQSATVQLGKALNDPIKGVTALTKVGVTFSAQQKEAIKTLMEHNNVMGAQKLILAEVNREFGGAAKAVGDTFAGGVARAKDKVRDFTRDLIINLQPILLSIGKTIGDLVNTYIKPLVDFLVKNKDSVANLTAIIVLGVTAYYAYKGAVVAVRVAQEAWAVVQVIMRAGQLATIASTNGMAASMLALNAAMAANPIGLVVAAIALLAAGFVIAWNHCQTFRNVIVEGMKGAVMGVGYLVKAFGWLVQAIMQVVMGPLKIFLKALSVVGFGPAKEGLKMINGAIDNVGTFFDNAGNKVQNFADKLDSLKKTKISLFGGGETKKEDNSSGGATAPTTGGGTAAQIKAALAAAKKAAKDAASSATKASKKAASEIAKQNKEVVKIYAEMNKAMAKESKDGAAELEKRDAAVVAMKLNYAGKELAITKTKNKSFADNVVLWNERIEKENLKHQNSLEKIDDAFAKRKDALADANDKRMAAMRLKASDEIAVAEKNAAQKKLDIIRQGIDALRSAFASGITANINEIWKAGATSADAMLAMLKTKLQDARTLQANAAKLSGAGYSQEFIQQVISNGPEIGNQMSKALLDATPQTKSQLQEMFYGLQDVSAHGLDALGAQMNTSTSFSTEALMKAYEQVPIDLAKTISEIGANLTRELASSNDDFTKSIADASETRDSAIATSKEDLTKALAEIDSLLAEANTKTMDTFNDAIKNNADNLATALEGIQTSYATAIENIAQRTKENLDTLTASLKTAAAALDTLGAKKAAVAALANAPSYDPIVPMRKESSLGGNNDYRMRDSTERRVAPSVTINAPITNNNAVTPASLGATVTSLYKYGIAVSIRGD